MALALVFGGNAASAQSSAEIQELRKELAALKAGQLEMQKTLQAIKDALMGKAPALEAVYITTAAAMKMGSEKAPLVMVEFSDYQCPFCGRFATTTFDSLVNEYVKTGKVQYAFKNFPLRDIHPYAQKAAEAAECMGEQGRYWEAHEKLFWNQQALEANDLVRYAEELGLDVPKFQMCFDGSKYVAKVNADLAEGLKLDVRGTPGFFLGYRDPKDPSRMQAVKFINGAVPLEEFKQTIDALLKR